MHFRKKRRKAAIIFPMSVCLSAWNRSVHTGRVFMKFGIWVFIKNMSRKFKFYLYLTKITDTWHGDVCTFMTSRSVLLKMRKFSFRGCRENQNTSSDQYLFFFENRVVHETVWKIMMERDRPQMTIWHMCVACWIIKDKSTHWECVIVIAFPQQKWLCQRASMLVSPLTLRRLMSYIYIWSTHSWCF